MGPFQFDNTISLGDVVTSVLFLIGILKAYGDLTILKFKVEQMWKWFDNRYKSFPPPDLKKR